MKRASLPRTSFTKNRATLAHSTVSPDKGRTRTSKERKRDDAQAAGGNIVRCANGSLIPEPFLREMIALAGKPQPDDLTGIQVDKLIRDAENSLP